MNQPFPMPGAPVASAPAPFPAVTPPMAPPATTAVDYPTKARQEIQQKVMINNIALVTPEQVAWGYLILSQRLGKKSSEPDMDKRIVGALMSTTTMNLIAPGSYAECVQQAVALIPDKIRWQGYKPASAEHAKSTFDWLLARSRQDSIGFSDEDLSLTLLAWLESLKAENPWELDEATRALKTQQPPPNPISDQKTPQVAQIVAPPVAPVVPGSEPEEKGDGKGEFVDKLTGYVCSSLRGLKSKVSKTHKKDWTAYCQEVGYDPETGKPATGAPTAAQAPGIGAQIPTAAPPAGPGMPPLVGQQPQAPVAQQQLYAAQDYPAPPVGPVAQVQMPTPVSAAQVPAGVPYPMGQPATIGLMPPGQTMAVGQPMQIAPAGQHSGMVAPPAMMQAVPQIPQQPMQHQPAMAPTTAISSFSRAENAKLLGGEVDLVLVRLVDAGAVPLTGRVDANQLAVLAQQQALQSLTSIEDMKFRKDKQIAQRLFGEMLTKHPGIFILQNGYDLILPEGFLEVIAARATSVYIAKDQGQSFTTIKFA